MQYVEIPPAPPASSAAVRAVMQGNRKLDTRPEAAVRSALHRRGLRFRKHVKPEIGLNCTADVVFTRARVAVFVDGCYWHGCPDHGTRPTTNSAYWDSKIARNSERDRRNDRVLSKVGWRVIRVWEHEDPDDAAAWISRIVQSRLANI